MKRLEDETDILSAEDRPLLLSHRKQIPVAYEYLSGVRPVQTAHTVKKRTLARAGLAHHRAKLPSLHGKGHILKGCHLCLALSVCLTQILYPYDFQYVTLPFFYTFVHACCPADISLPLHRYPLSVHGTFSAAPQTFHFV